MNFKNFKYNFTILELYSKELKFISYPDSMKKITKCNVI